MSDNPYAGLQLSQLIDLLEPVTEPARPSLMPQTGGWIVLAVLLLAALVWGIRKAMMHHRRNAYRRFALDAVQSAGDDPAVLAQILRLTALTAYPRDRIASLKGAQWLQFLDDSANLSGFVNGPGQALATAPYRPTPRDPKLTVLARRWIQKHAPLKEQT